MPDFLQPATHLIEAGVMAKELTAATGKNKLSSMYINALLAKQRRTTVNARGSFVPLFRNIVPNFTPNRHDYAQLLDADFSLDALAIWGIAEANLSGSPKWHNEAHVTNIGTVGMEALISVVDTVLPWGEAVPQPEPIELIKIYRQIPT